MLTDGDVHFKHQFHFFSPWLVGLALLDRGQAQFGFPCAVCALVQVRFGCFLERLIWGGLTSIKKSYFHQNSRKNLVQYASILLIFGRIF